MSLNSSNVEPGDRSQMRSKKRKVLCRELIKHPERAPLHLSARKLVLFWTQTILKDELQQQQDERESSLDDRQIFCRAAAIEKKLYRTATCLPTFLDRTTLSHRIAASSREIRLQRMNQIHQIDISRTNNTSIERTRKVQFVDCDGSGE